VTWKNQRDYEGRGRDPALPFRNEVKSKGHPDLDKFFWVVSRERRVRVIVKGLQMPIQESLCKK
jgi:hypothetical protein